MVQIAQKVAQIIGFWCMNAEGIARDFEDFGLVGYCQAMGGSRGSAIQELALYQPWIIEFSPGRPTQVCSPTFAATETLAVRYNLSAGKRQHKRRKCFGEYFLVHCR